MLGSAKPFLIRQGTCTCQGTVNLRRILRLPLPLFRLRERGVLCSLAGLSACWRCATPAWPIAGLAASRRIARGYPGICAWVEPNQLIEAALADVRRGAAWVKIIADFPGPDGNWFAAPPSYPPELLETLVRAVHAAGARVLAHSTGLAAADLVRAGVDTIEHGMQLNCELLERMAERRIGWSLTMATALLHVGPIAEQAGPAGQYVRAELARVRELLPLAASLGVPLLAGTDELPHGALAREMAELQRFGLTPAQAIAAASTGARAFLGFPAFEPGAPADLVTFAADPRRDLAVLAHPQAIVFGGRLVAL